MNNLRTNNIISGFLQRLLTFMLFLLPTACDDFLDVGTPKNQITTKSVYTDDKTANSAVLGIYSKMVENASIATNAAIQGGLSSDELQSASGNLLNLEFYNNNVSITNSSVLTFWRQAYQYVYYCNAVLEGLNGANSPDIKALLEGEAKLTRAFVYFNLTNLFGDVPLVLTTDYAVNSSASKSSQSVVFDQVVADLKDAQKLLSESYPADAEQRIRPNKSVAAALLARVYLYKGDWVSAEAMSTEVINNDQYALDGLDNVFLSSSPEIIWQLIPVRQNLNSNLGNIFVLTGTPNQAYLSNQLFDSFEPGDQRKVSWIGARQVGSVTYNYPNKYKIKNGATVTEFNVILRLAEQYLIRAEARANQGNVSGSQEDLNVIRERAGLSQTAAGDKDALLKAIEDERRFELFAEEGNHRWFDLKRTNRADVILGALKPAWQPGDALYPIPQVELVTNTNLLPQNEGY